MARKQARVAAMQLIYEQMEGGDGGEETLRGLIGFEPAAPGVSGEEAPAQEPQPEQAIPAEGEPADGEAPAPDPAYEEDKAFIQALVEGVCAHTEELDGRISAYLRDWPLERIAKVDLAILRLSFYELLYLEDAPETVVINEAVEMAKRYSTDKSGAFVNGVLGALCRREKA